MYSKGYFQAKILDIKSQVRDGTRTVVLNVAEGPRYRLGKITIDGNQVFSDRAILESLGQKSGDVADGPALTDFVYEKLKQKYDELGYVQYNAEFEPDFSQPRDWKVDGIVDVLITIDEGPRFKVRRIGFPGVAEGQEESLLGEFLVKQGDIFSQQRLRNALDKFNELERFYRLDMDHDVEFRTDEESREIDVIITLRIPRQ